MKCEEASGHINEFIDGSFDNDELLSEYLEHICSCSACYEELDVMYIVSEGLNGLKTNEDISFDFTGSLADKIREAKEGIRRAKIKKRRYLMIDVGCILIIINVIAAILLDVFFWS
ncbi:MAG: hypothetical protein IKN24_04565 [Lachnospiraceae bacterium]|nr:hypothetical protein [Lachnospiraceae bacterium]